MFDLATTKVMDSLVKNDFTQAEKDIQTIQDNLVTYPLLNYLILLNQDTKQAIDFWTNTNTSKVDLLFQHVIQAYNFFLQDKQQELKNFVLTRIQTPIHNFIEASNLSFYAHSLNLSEQIHLLSKAKELKVPSALLIAEKQTGDFCLFHPITLLKIHYQVVQFLNSNFESEQDLEEFVKKMKSEKPL